jgi:hypothetical protein
VGYIFLNPDGSFSLGLLLVVGAPTGVVYATQCAGHLNEERSMEGFLVPVGGEREAKQLFDWFWANFRGHCYPSGVRLSAEQVSELRQMVGEIPCWLTSKDDEGTERGFLELDLSRIDECVEAWIPVLSPLGAGVLTLNNSD